ncbi:YrzI family small protein [Bacillus rubiinfantis]|nr:YrzI family small protein [Bacillus rubiinfantis]
MTINILFLTINIKKRKISVQEAIRQERVEQLYEEHKDRLYSLRYFR